MKTAHFVMKAFIKSSRQLGMASNSQKMEYLRKKIFTIPTVHKITSQEVEPLRSKVINFNGDHDQDENTNKLKIAEPAFLKPLASSSTLRNT